MLADLRLCPEQAGSFKVQGADCEENRHFFTDTLREVRQSASWVQVGHQAKLQIVIEV